MDLLELFNLIWASRNDMGFGTIIVYLVPVVIAIAVATEFMERRYLDNLKVRSNQELLREARLEGRRFAMEVEAWKQAARNNRGSK